jgi:hypothetical protein
MVKEVTSTLRTTVQMSVTRQDSTTRTLLAKIADLQKSQIKSEAMLLKIYQHQQQQQQNRQHPSINRHQQQSTVAREDDEGANGGNGIGDLADLLQEEPGNDNEDGKVSFTTRQARSAKRMGMNQFETMLPEARMPKVDGEFPECWVDMVLEWDLDDLQSFTTVKTTRWKSKVIVARFTKRYRAMRMLRQYIWQVGEVLSESEAAIRLDTEREHRKLSLSKHMAILFKNDNTVKRRIRAIKVNNNNNTNINTTI